MTEQREQGAFKQAATGAGRRLSQQNGLLIKSHNRWFRFLETPVHDVECVCGQLLKGYLLDVWEMQVQAIYIA